MGPVVFHQPPGPVEPASIAPVGNYAISFAWTDGHSTGIYRFDFLRQICPCDECRGKRQEEAEGGSEAAGQDGDGRKEP